MGGSIPKYFLNGTYFVDTSLKVYSLLAKGAVLTSSMCRPELVSFASSVMCFLVLLIIKFPVSDPYIVGSRLGFKVFAPIKLNPQNLKPTNHWPEVGELVNFKVA